MVLDPRGGRRRGRRPPSSPPAASPPAGRSRRRWPSGAEGVWCGSVWLTTEEAETHPLVKEKFLAATSSDTVRSRATTGKPARAAPLARGPTSGTDPANPDAAAHAPARMLIAEAQGRIARAAETHLGAHDLAQLLRRPGRRPDERRSSRPAMVVLDMVDEFITATERIAGLLQA